MERLTAEFEGKACLKAMLTETAMEPVDCLECDMICTGNKGCGGCPIQEAFSRLAAYEDLGCTPGQLVEIDRLYSEQARELGRYRELGTVEECGKAVERQQAAGWIPAEQPPECGKYVLLSFSNFSVPLIGRYEEDAQGGAYYIGDDMETAASQDVYVDAWQQLPGPYRKEEPRG